MPALAECLTRGTGDVQSLLDAIGSSSAFDLVPFGQREAIELAEMNRATLATGNKRRGIDARRQQIKVDRQIVATAKVANASALHTDDEGMKRVAESEGLQVVRTVDLPTPEHQTDMFGD